MAMKKARGKARRGGARKAVRKPAQRARARKPAKKAVKGKKVAKLAMLGTPVGTVSHYFTHISVGVVELNGALKVGDKIRVVGATTNFEQKVGSMQVDLKPVNEAGPGDSIGLKVSDRVREGDMVYKV